jgi:hypothetical protein
MATLEERLDTMAKCLELEMKYSSALARRLGALEATLKSMRPPGLYGSATEVPGDAPVEIYLEGGR